MTSLMRLFEKDELDEDPIPSTSDEMSDIIEKDGGKRWG